MAHWLGILWHFWAILSLCESMNALSCYRAIAGGSFAFAPVAAHGAPHEHRKD